MKRQLILIIGILGITTLFSENKIYIYKSSGSLISTAISVVDSISFKNSSTELNIYKTDNTVTNVLISSIDSIKFKDEAIVSYTAPTYSDDYSTMASWTFNASWNLAN